MNCPYGVTVKLLATGRKGLLGFNLYQLPDEPFFSAEERDRLYLAKQETGSFAENDPIQLLPTGSSGYTSGTVSTETYSYTAERSPLVSLGAFGVTTIHSNFTATKNHEEQDSDYFDNCSSQLEHYIGTTTTDVFTGFLSPAGSLRVSHDRTIVTTTKETEDVNGQCSVTTTSSTSNPAQADGPFSRPTGEIKSRVSASAYQHTRSDPAGKKSGSGTITYQTWFKYSNAIAAHSEAVQLLEQSAPTDITPKSSTAPMIDGELHGQCGHVVLNHRTFVLSKYEVQFNDGYTDKDHNVTGIDIQHLDTVDVVVRIQRDLGKPTQIRVMGDIVEQSQDSPPVETITAFNELLNVGAEDLTQSNSVYHAWRYGSPSSWASKLSAPTAGGTIFIRNLSVQIDPGSFFE